jgi:hypothetical protein
MVLSPTRVGHHPVRVIVVAVPVGGCIRCACPAGSRRSPSAGRRLAASVAGSSGSSSSVSFALVPAGRPPASEHRLVHERKRRRRQECLDALELGAVAKVVVRCARPSRSSNSSRSVSSGSMTASKCMLAARRVLRAGPPDRPSTPADDAGAKGMRVPGERASSAPFPFPAGLGRVESGPIAGWRTRS